MAPNFFLVPCFPSGSTSVTSFPTFRKKTNKSIQLQSNKPSKYKDQQRDGNHHILIDIGEQLHDMAPIFFLLCPLSRFTSIPLSEKTYKSVQLSSTAPTKLKDQQGSGGHHILIHIGESLPIYGSKLLPCNILMLRLNFYPQHSNFKQENKQKHTTISSTTPSKHRKQNWDGNHASHYYTC